MSSGPSARHGEVFALHRYFIWSDEMRKHLETVLLNIGEARPDMLSEAGIRSFLSMSYWYGGLYVVIEGWRELGLHDDAIDRLLESPNVDLLRRYRHGAFHYQREYLDRRFTDFMEPEAGTVQWIDLFETNSVDGSLRTSRHLVRRKGEADGLSLSTEAEERRAPMSRRRAV